MHNHICRNNALSSWPNLELLSWTLSFSFACPEACFGWELPRGHITAENLQDWFVSCVFFFRFCFWKLWLLDGFRCWWAFSDSCVTNIWGKTKRFRQILPAASHSVLQICRFSPQGIPPLVWLLIGSVFVLYSSRPNRMTPTIKIQTKKNFSSFSNVPLVQKETDRNWRDTLGKQTESKRSAISCASHDQAVLVNSLEIEKCTCRHLSFANVKINLVPFGTFFQKTMRLSALCLLLVQNVKSGQQFCLEKSSFWGLSATTG